MADIYFYMTPADLGFFLTQKSQKIAWLFIMFLYGFHSMLKITTVFSDLDVSVKLMLKSKLMLIIVNWLYFE